MNREGSSAVVLLSGGLDSTTALYYARQQCDRVVALSVNYGQRHAKELQFAGMTCHHLNVDHRIVDVPIGFGRSSLLNEMDVPEGHYAEESMKQTVVPNRNMVMIALAGSLAESLGFNRVYVAVHAGDHYIYPDCRQSFVSPMREALKAATEGRVFLMTPFITMTKTEIVKLGSDLGVDYSLTWSCYKGGEEHCSKCGTCVERIEAFREAGVLDPTVYLDYEGALMILEESNHGH